MTEPAEALRALLDRPPSSPPPVEELRRRVEGRRRRRVTCRIALAGLATVLGAVAVVPLLDRPSNRTTRVVAGPLSSTTTVARNGPRVEFQAPDGWTTLFTFGPTMVVATRPLSESDRALALLARDDVAFTAFPPDAVVVVVGMDPVQAKYGFDPATNTPLDPGPEYALGAERVLAGGVRVRRGDVPRSGVRIASYAVRPPLPPGCARPRPSPPGCGWCSPLPIRRPG